MKRILLSLLTFFLISGPVQSEDKKPREGGILGTGIVGTITQLGSIYVNEQHIRFDPDLRVKTAFGPRKAATLVPGETVVVRAIESSGAWLAEEITLYHPLIGPLRQENGAFFVMGTQVEAENAEILSNDGLQDGDWVSVSGLWRMNEVVASRIEEVSAKPRATLIGSYVENDDRSFLIGGTAVNQLTLEHVQTGDVLTVQGRPNGNSLDATNVKIGLFEKPVTHIIAQGFLSVPDRQGLYTVLGSGVVSFTDRPEQITGTEFGIFCNVKEDNSERYIMTKMNDVCGES